MHTAT